MLAWERAAETLWDHWTGGRRLESLPDDVKPASRSDGYAIQALLGRKSSRPLFGWKIAATSAAGQAHIAVDGPIAGRLLAERAHKSGAELPFGDNHMRVAEPEFAFRMGRTLEPRPEPYAAEEVVAAAAALHPAIEIPDSRFEDFTVVGAAQLIADNACAHDFVLGPETQADWRAVDLSGHPVRATVEGRIERQGSGANVLGDPRLALAWLANELSGLGIPLEAGQVVTTGTCMTPLAILPGDKVTADFGPFGTVSVSFKQG